MPQPLQHQLLSKWCYVHRFSRWLPSASSLEKAFQWKTLVLTAARSHSWEASAMRPSLPSKCPKAEALDTPEGKMDVCPGCHRPFGVDTLHKMVAVTEIFNHCCQQRINNPKHLLFTDLIPSRVREHILPVSIPSLMLLSDLSSLSS